MNLKNGTFKNNYLYGQRCLNVIIHHQNGAIVEADVLVSNIKNGKDIGLIRQLKFDFNLEITQNVSNFSDVFNNGTFMDFNSFFKGKDEIWQRNTGTYVMKTNNNEPFSEKNFPHYLENLLEKDRKRRISAHESPINHYFDCNDNN